MNALPLTGCSVGISISESEDTLGASFDSHEVNRCVCLLAETLLGNGARLVFGHDWRPDGVMMAVADFALRYAPPGSRSPSESPSSPLIVNRLAPPDKPFLRPVKRSRSSPDEGEENSDIVRNQLSAMLGGIVDAKTISYLPTGDNRRIRLAEGLSHLREELTGLCDTRICIGGRFKGFRGWYPGVAEEAYLALAHKQPLYISAIFGGTSAAIAKFVLNGGRPPVWKPAPLGEKTARRSPLSFEGLRLMPNGLTAEEQARLCDPPSLEACVELILRGLVKWWTRPAGPSQKPTRG